MQFTINSRFTMLLIIMFMFSCLCVASHHHMVSIDTSEPSRPCIYVQHSLKLRDSTVLEPRGVGKLDLEFLSFPDVELFWLIQGEHVFGLIHF